MRINSLDRSCPDHTINSDLTERCRSLSINSTKVKSICQLRKSEAELKGAWFLPQMQQYVAAFIKHIKPSLTLNRCPPTHTVSPSPPRPARGRDKPVSKTSTSFCRKTCTELSQLPQGRQKESHGHSMVPHRIWMRHWRESNKLLM